MNNAKSVQQLIKEAHDYALAGRVEAALDSYNEALAILISLETILAGQGEGTQSVVMTANPELQASAHSEKLTQARTLVAHEAVSLCITTGQAESAFQYLSILKGRRLMMRLARSQSEDKFPKSDFHIVNDGEPVIHVKEAGSQSIVAFIEFYYDDAQGDTHCLISIAEGGGVKSNWRRIFNQQQTLAVRNYLSKFLNFRVYEDRNTYLSSLFDLMKMGFGPLVDDLAAHKVAKVILIPHRFLHLLPWHGCASPTNDKPLYERIKIVTYASNASFYERSATARYSDKMKSPTIAGCIDVEGLRTGWASSLVFAAHFSHHNPQMLLQSSKQAVLDALKDATFFLFEGHGITDFENYANSRLLAFDGYVTFKDLLTLDYPSSIFLAILNACETGVNPNFEDIQDEYYGLDGALLATGARHVISTLWPVQDMAAFLMSFRLQKGILMGEGWEPATLLGSAATWLRTGDWRNDLNLIIKICDFSRLEQEVPLGFKDEVRLVGESFTKHLTALQPDAFAKQEHWSAWRCSGFGGNVKADS